jgi:hypothetical protein
VGRQDLPREANASYNRIDGRLKKGGDQSAVIWEGDGPYDDEEDLLRQRRQERKSSLVPSSAKMDP